MLPQNGQQSQRPQQQQGFPAFPPQNGGGFDGGSFFNLDPGQAAKQMAALNAAGHARISSNSRAPPSAGGTSSGTYFGAINPHASSPMPNTALLEPGMSGREQGFLNGLHNLHLKQGKPLPPAITGASIPNYDHATSAWSALEPGSEVGCFKLGGKDIRLFKLWGIVFQLGGGEALNRTKGWGQVAQHFHLPDEIPTPSGPMPGPTALAQYYKVILAGFEESYKANMAQNQRKAVAAARQGGMMSMPGGPPAPGMPQQPQMNDNAMAMQRMGMNPMNPAMSGAQLASNGMPRPPQNQQPNQRPPSAMMVPPVGDSILPTDVNLLDPDIQGIKRKLESGELDNKRVRPRTDGQDGAALSLGMLDRQSSEPQVPQAQVTQPAPPNVVRPRQQPSRRKIEYVPLARELNTYGGRDLAVLEAEYAQAFNKPRLRNIGDWGTVEVDHLTLSIRSRLSTELSYALTTFTLLSTMKGHQEGQGFPIIQCPELLDEVLDLVEDFAFGGPEPPADDTPSRSDFYTNKQLVNAILDEQDQPFAALSLHQGSKDPEAGPMQRPASYILAVVNIIRNLSTFTDNLETLAKHDRLFDILFRLGTVVTKNGVPKPASPVLSLSDVVSIRKDTLHCLSGIANVLPLSPRTPPDASTKRFVQRAVDLVSSYLVDPAEAVSPLGWVGVPVNPYIRPPALADLALEVLVRFVFPDHNRQVIGKAASQESLWRLMEGLVHRMPIVEADFVLMQQEHWASHLGQLIMAIYILVFLAPSDLKHKLRSDRRLGLKSVLTRLLSRWSLHPESRSRFYHIARRVTETLKLLDDALDPFDNPVDSAVPALAFGMGFQDSNDGGQEKGTGLLGAHRDLGWEMLMSREVQSDEILFRELESLVRVECQ